jgi:hypothetical protein
VDEAQTNSDQASGVARLGIVIQKVRQPAMQKAAIRSARHAPRVTQTMRDRADRKQWISNRYRSAPLELMLRPHSVARPVETVNANRPGAVPRQGSATTARRRETLFIDGERIR